MSQVLRIFGMIEGMVFYGPLTTMVNLAPQARYLEVCTNTRSASNSNPSDPRGLFKEVLNSFFKEKQKIQNIFYTSF